MSYGLRSLSRELVISFQVANRSQNGGFPWFVIWIRKPAVSSEARLSLVFHYGKTMEMGPRKLLSLPIFTGHRCIPSAVVHVRETIWGKSRHSLVFAISPYLSLVKNYQ